MAEGLCPSCAGFHPGGEVCTKGETSLITAQCPKENETQEKQSEIGYVTGQTPTESDDERRIILIGKIGAGKSQSGNAILGYDYNKVFIAKKALRSVTLEVKYGTTIRNGKLYRVYDTPGALNPDDKELFSEEVRKCLFCTSPGFHCLTIVISVAERPNKEDLNLFKKLEETLGQEFENHAMIVFTKAEDENELNEILAQSECLEINKLIKRCNSRYVCFGEDKKGVDKKFVDKYHKILEELITQNIRKDRSFYRHPLYEKAQELIVNDAKKIREGDDLSMTKALEKARERAIAGESNINKLLEKEMNRWWPCTIL